MQVSHQAECLEAAGRICDPSLDDRLDQVNIKGNVIIEGQETNVFDPHFCIVNVCFTRFKF